MQVVANNLSIIILTEHKIERELYLKLKRLSSDCVVKYERDNILIVFFFNRVSSYQDALELLNKKRLIEIESIKPKAVLDIIDINYDYVKVKYSSGVYKVPLKIIKVFIDILERPMSVSEFESILNNMNIRVNIKKREGNYVNCYILPYLLLQEFGKDTGKINIFKKKKEDNQTYIYLSIYCKREEVFPSFLNWLKDKIKVVE